MSISTSDWEFPELLPPPGHEKVGPRIFALLEEVVKDKISLGLHDKWLYFYKLGRNKHWKREAREVPLATANLLHVHRQRTVNMLTDNNPTFNLVEVGSTTDDDRIERLQKMAMYWWREEEQQSHYEDSVRDGETYGLTIEKVVFNPDREGGLGEIETINVDPFHYGLWPIKCRQVQQAQACFHFYPVNIRELKKRYPDKAALIKPDKDLLQELGEERREVQIGSNRDSIVARVGNSIKTLFAGGMEKTTDSEETVIVECWCKDFTLNENKELVYPGAIRCVTACNAGKLVLEDRGNPSVNLDYPIEKIKDSYLFDKYPFIVANSYRDSATFWGMSDFEQLEQLQLQFNKALSQYLFIKDKSSRPKTINPKTSGIPNTHFTNAPGIINPKNSIEAAAIRVLDMPQLPVDLDRCMELLQELFFLVSGTFNLEQSQTPGKDVIAYKAIAALLENAATMMRGKIRNYSRLLRERGRMYISHVQNWYTEDRFFFFEEDGKSISGSLNGTEVQMPIKLSVVNGSMLPVSKVQQREEALVLYEKGAIDQQDLLEKLEWSNRSKVLERMQAGMVGAFLGRLAEVGAPPEILEVMQQISSLEDKEFDKVLKEGSIPALVWPQADNGETMQAIQLKLEEEKLKHEQAKRQLIEEQISTERVEQRVKEAGIDFDQEKLAIEREKTLMEASFKEEQLTQTAKETNVTERGLKSNNKKEKK